MKPRDRLLAAARLGVLAALTIYCQSPAQAGTKQPGKPWSYGLDISLSPPPAPVTTPARFFKINQVLAKIDGRNSSSGPIRFAALTNPSSAADMPGTVENKPGGGEPFGLMGFAAPGGTLQDKWRKIDAEIKADVTALQACQQDPEGCSLETLRLAELVAIAKRRTGSDRIDQVNRLVNAEIRYTSDFAQYGVADRWAAPLASLRSRRGDCEDYAFLKYVILREAGLPADDMRVLLVRDRVARQDHAILAVKDGEGWKLLDNRFNDIASDHSSTRTIPVFSIGPDGVKLLAAPFAFLDNAGPMADVDILPGTSDADLESSSTVATGF